MTADGAGQARKLDLNAMDIALAYKEGGAVSLPIGQIKEMRRLVLEHLGNLVTEHHDGAETVLAACRNAYARSLKGQDDGTDDET